MLEPQIEYELLTPRELEVLSYVAIGLLNSEVARMMGIQATTVETHLEHIYDKLSLKEKDGINPRSRAVWLVQQQQWLSEEQIYRAWRNFELVE